MRLILIRHGESVGNFENRLQGHTDYDLTPKGEAQARQTAERLHELGIKTVYTSPLRRAAATALAIGERLGSIPIELPGAWYDRRARRRDLPGTAPALLCQSLGQTAAGPAVSIPARGRNAFPERVSAAVWAGAS
jgi:broad specificity phosphatase PhoE